MNFSNSEDGDFVDGQDLRHVCESLESDLKLYRDEKNTTLLLSLVICPENDL